LTLQGSIIPKIDPREISNVGERDVATALVEQLPDEVIIYHSYPWLRAERNDIVRHGGGVKKGKLTLRKAKPIS